MEVTATAPGKVFLLGEYAVALGGPAVVAAVDRRLGCRVSRGRGAGRLSVRVSGDSYEGQLDADTLAGIPTACRFATAAVLVSARHLRLSEVDFTVETWSGIDGDGAKVGLGGSAAVVAAVTGAIHGLAGRDACDAGGRASLGVAAHRLAQGGGSGADVVASTLGGIHRIEGLAAEDPPHTVSACGAGVSFRATRIDLPSALRLDVVATSTAARTGPRVRRFVDRARGRGRLGGGGAAIVECWSDGMADAVARFEQACRTGSVADALAGIARARSLLGRLGAVAGIPIWTAELRRACGALGREAGVEIKPSGAGGGDCAVALVREELRPALRSAWTEAGLRPLEVEASLEGVTVEVGNARRGDG